MHLLFHSLLEPHLSKIVAWFLDYQWRVLVSGAKVPGAPRACVHVGLCAQVDMRYRCASPNASHAKVICTHNAISSCQVWMGLYFYILKIFNQSYVVT